MRVLIVDDHTLVRRGLAHVVRDCFEGADVVEASDADEAMTMLEGPVFDVALLDVRLPGKDGLELLHEIKELHADLPVIMLSTYDHARYARRALGEGAAGYMLKDSSPADLAQAISVALSGGGNVLSSKVIQNLFDEQEQEEHPVGRGEDPDAALTRREIDILQLLVTGNSNRDIAGELTLSEKTVKAHLASVFRKLGVANRTQAAMAAVAMGLGDAGAAGRARTTQAGS